MIGETDLLYAAGAAVVVGSVWFLKNSHSSKSAYEPYGPPAHGAYGGGPSACSARAAVASEGKYITEGAQGASADGAAAPPRPPLPTGMWSGLFPPVESEDFHKQMRSRHLPGGGENTTRTRENRAEVAPKLPLESLHTKERGPPILIAGRTPTSGPTPVPTGALLFGATESYSEQLELARGQRAA